MAAVPGQFLPRNTVSLYFDNVEGPWAGNDYPTVSMTSVSFSAGGPAVAYVFMTHVMVDFDGASNAYGPPRLNPLDSLADAGRFNASTGYYGLMAIDPENDRVNPDRPYDAKKNPLVKDRYQLQWDTDFPDTKGRFPVIQKSDDLNPGFYVSATSGGKPGVSLYKQSRYIDSAKVEFGALSYRLQSKNIDFGNYGMAINIDNGKQSGFTFKDGGHKKDSDKSSKVGAFSPDPKKPKQTLEGAVGECSYKVFLNLGGKPKTPAQKLPDNGFPTIFMVFPGSGTSQLAKLSTATNADDLPLLLAFYAQADLKSKGSSGKPLLDDYVAKGRKDPRPKAYDKVLLGLKAGGYTGAAPAPAALVGRP